jgi:hypothetical protein
MTEVVTMSLRVPIYWDEAISWRGIRLPRTFQVLAMTKKEGLAMTPLLSLRGRLRPAETIFSLLSLRGAEGDEAISVGDGGVVYA